jgi:hypothetical protein
MDTYKVSLFTYLTMYGEDVWLNTQATVRGKNDEHFYTDKIPIDKDNLFQSIVGFTKVRQITYSMEGCVIEAICIQLGIKINRQAPDFDNVDLSAVNKMDELSFGDRACHISFYSDTIEYKDILHCYYTALKHLHSKMESYAEYNN